MLHSRRRFRTGPSAYRDSALQRQPGRQNTEDSGYHETLTCFWHDAIRDFIATLPAGLDRLAVARAVMAEFGPRRDLFREYYDFDVVNSRQARAKWIPPTLTPPCRPQSR
jgi:hypothetical protein